MNESVSKSIEPLLWDTSRCLLGLKPKYDVQELANKTQRRDSSNSGRTGKALIQLERCLHLTVLASKPNASVDPAIVHSAAVLTHVHGSFTFRGRFFGQKLLVRIICYVQSLERFDRYRGCISPCAYKVVLSA